MTNTRRIGPLKLKAQLLCGEDLAMGPGKADLLDAIDHEGSISAAGRAMGMSYRRAWLLVDTMNRCWAEPLVAATAGGSQGRGAHLTDSGRKVLDAYRALEAKIAKAADSQDLQVLRDLMLAEPRVSQKAHLSAPAPGSRASAGQSAGRKRTARP